MRRYVCLVILAATTTSLASSVSGDELGTLRLVPFPKKVELTEGAFLLDRQLVLETTAASAKWLGHLITEEARRAGMPAPEVRTVASDLQFLRLSAKPGKVPSMPRFRNQATPQDYVLRVHPDEVDCVSPSDIGLGYAVQTLCQLIRANRRGPTLPCMNINDW
ncbi:MAG: glycoside hydrolase family 20 zincin-like fold domain-containing protein, partial [Thermoguttaceae bacterium]